MNLRVSAACAWWGRDVSTIAGLDPCKSARICQQRTSVGPTSHDDDVCKKIAARENYIHISHKEAEKPTMLIYRHCGTDELYFPKSKHINPTRTGGDEIHPYPMVFCPLLKNFSPMNFPPQNNRLHPLTALLGHPVKNNLDFFLLSKKSFNKSFLK